MREKNISRNISKTLIQTDRPNQIAFHAGKQELRSAEIEALSSMFEKLDTEP